MLLEYSEQDHAYYADGKNFPSVTELLNRAGLISDFCKNNPQATWRGQSVHTLTAIDDRERLDLRTVPVELRGYLKSWRNYRKDTGFTPTLIEERVDHPERGYSGRLDRAGGFFSDRLQAIVDIKTGAVTPWTRLQLTAYAHALGVVCMRVAVGLKPDGTYKVQIYPIENYQIDLAEWLSIVERMCEI